MKFWALIISADLSLKRMWMSEVEAIILINGGCKIYNAATQQEAVIVKKEILWKNVEEVKSFG